MKCKVFEKTLIRELEKRRRLRNMKKNVTLIDGGDNIKKFLKSLARSILIVAGIAIITMGVSEVSFRRIEKIEEENCWQVLGDAAQAVNNEIVIRMEENINTLHLVSEIMTGEDIVYSYKDIKKHIDGICGNTIFKRIDILYPGDTLLFHNGETQNVSEFMSFEELAEKGEHMSERTVDFLDGSTKIICYYVPVIQEKETVAIVGGLIDCEQLSKSFQTRAYSGEAYTMIIDRSDGAFLLDDWHNELGNLYNKPEYQPRKGYRHINLIEEIKNGQTGEIAYLSETYQKDAYTYYMPIGIFDWQLLLIVPGEIAFSSLYEVREILTVMGTAELILLVAYFGIFLVNAHRLKKSKLETEKQLKISNTLIQCISTLSSDKNMDKAINKVLKIATEYFDGERAYLFEIDYERQTTSNTYEYAIEGVTKEIGNLQNVPISAITNWIEKFKKTGMFCISDLDKDIKKDTNTYSILEAQNIHSLIAVPLKDGEEIIGFFGVDNPKVNYDNLSLISSTAYFLLNSLEKRQYQEGLERLSYEDALTKLYNRNKFEETIDELKENRPQSIGVAYIDLNGLKIMNDKFGHKAGDQLIKKAGRNIALVFGDSVFRIGGDEFVVIVSDIGEADFQNKMEQVVSYMKKEEVSISLGISWAENGTDILRQIHEADERMYEDKKRYYENSAMDRRKGDRRG